MRRGPGTPALRSEHPCAGMFCRCAGMKHPCLGVFDPHEDRRGSLGTRSCSVHFEYCPLSHLMAGPTPRRQSRTRIVRAAVAPAGNHSSSLVLIVSAPCCTTRG